MYTAKNGNASYIHLWIYTLEQFVQGARSYKYKEPIENIFFQIFALSNIVNSIFCHKIDTARVQEIQIHLVDKIKKASLATVQSVGKITVYYVCLEQTYLPYPQLKSGIGKWKGIFYP